MKKPLALILALTLALTLAACGGANSSGSDAAPNAGSGEHSAAGGSAMISNPWAEVSADELFGYIGYRFGVPEAAADVKYFWNEAGGLAEMRFTDGSGVSFTARAKKTDAPEDISGMYYDFASNPDNYGNGTDCFIRNNGQELCGEWHVLEDGGSCANLGLWFYPGPTGSYSLSLGAVTELGVIDLSTPAGEIFLLESAEGDPMEYTREYWEAKYPGENLCPFYIEIDGTEYAYFCLHSAPITEWLEQEFNWNGWHFYDGSESIIVNGDETRRITEEDMEQGFSSFCVYHTEAFDPDGQ